MCDWDICASDDEWNVYNEHFPKRLVMLFNDIAERNVLPLSHHCPRKGAVTDSQPSSLSGGGAVLSPIQQLTVPDKNPVVEIKTPEQIKAFEAFEFDSQDNAEKPLAKRKTPTTLKRGKKITSSMTNVVNDLLRNKFLDELEATKSENKPEPPTS